MKRAHFLPRELHIKFRAESSPGKTGAFKFQGDKVPKTNTVWQSFSFYMLEWYFYIPLYLRCPKIYRWKAWKTSVGTVRWKEILRSSLLKAFLSPLITPRATTITLSDTNQDCNERFQSKRLDVRKEKMQVFEAYCQGHTVIVQMQPKFCQGSHYQNQPCSLCSRFLYLHI